LFVFNAVLLVTEIPAPKAIMASLTIVAEGAVRAVDALVKEGRERTLFTVDTLITTFAFLNSKAVGTILTIDREIARIKTVLAVPGIDAHVAVPVVR